MTLGVKPLKGMFLGFSGSSAVKEPKPLSSKPLPAVQMALERRAKKAEVAAEAAPSAQAPAGSRAAVSNGFIPGIYSSRIRSWVGNVREGQGRSPMLQCAAPPPT